METKYMTVFLLFLVMIVQMISAIPVGSGNPPPTLEPPPPPPSTTEPPTPPPSTTEPPPPPTSTTEPPPPPPPERTGCHYEGKFYAVGSFQLNPCQHCQCESSGEAHCYIIDCFYDQCVDPKNDPTKCCKVCPNGPNCRAPDGEIIKEGETYKPDPYTTCTCPEYMYPSYRYDSHMADCVRKPVAEEPPETAVL